MKKETLIAITQMINATSNDQTRYHMTGILIESDADTRKTKLVATDGHILLEQSLDDDSMPTGKWFADRDQVKALVGILKANKYMPGFDSDVDPSDQAGKLTIKANGQTVQLSKGDSYPDYARVIPSAEQCPFTVSINAKLLLSLTKAMGLDSEQPIIKIHFNPENVKSPFLIQGTKQGMASQRAVICPCTVSDSENVANKNWLFDAGTTAGLPEARSAS